MTASIAGRAPLLGIVATLLVAVAARIAALPIPGHDGDVTVMARWAERMAAVGPPAFYDGAGSIYPALLYPLWALGAALDGDALARAIKALSIPFDVALIVVVYAGFRRRVGGWPAVAAAALYGLNPATVLAGPLWGQVDAAGTLPLVGAVLAAGARRDGAAGALAVVAGLVKPQFGLVALPLVVVVALRARQQGTWRPAATFLVAGVLAYAVISAPLLLHPPRYLGLLADTAAFQPFTSLHAFNPWALIVGFKVPDDPYVGAGSALLLAGLGGALLGLRRGLDLWVLLGVVAAASLAFYFLPTRVHERYLFPAIALLAPFAVTGIGRLAAYVSLSIGFAASLLYALDVTTSFELPAAIAGPLTSNAGVWAIGLVMIGSAAALTWLVLVRDPRPEHRHRGGPAA